MKKLLILTLALCVMLCACKKNTPAETTAETTAEPTVTTTAETTVITTAEETTAPIVTEIVPDYGSDVDVKYEVLTLDDEELNAILDARSADILASYIPNIPSKTNFGGSAEYNVKLESMYKSEKILSAVFSGTYAIYYDNSEEGGEVLYTVNIDRATGKILSTSDIVDFDKMVEAFKNGRFDVSPDFSQYSSAYEIYPYVYLDEGRITVCVTRSGMYEEVLRYSISYSDAQDFLKIEE